MKKTKTKRKKRSKPQKNVNQMAFNVVATITEHDAARVLGRKGGIARKAKQSKERLSEIGREGADSRWHKDKGKPIVATKSIE
jgi:hypothetical protein